MDEPLRRLRQLPVLLLREIARRSSNVELEHSLSRLGIGKRDVDSFLESEGERDEQRRKDEGESASVREEDEETRCREKLK